MDYRVTEMAHPNEVNKSSIKPGSHIRRALPSVGPSKPVTSKVGVLEACLQHNSLEGFEGGESRMADAELVSMGEGGIEVPYDTPRQGG